MCNAHFRAHGCKGRIEGVHAQPCSLQHLGDPPKHHPTFITLRICAHAAVLLLTFVEEGAEALLPLGNLAAHVKNLSHQGDLKLVKVHKGCSWLTTNFQLNHNGSSRHFELFTSRPINPRIDLTLTFPSSAANEGRVLPHYSSDEIRLQHYLSLYARRGGATLLQLGYLPK